MIGLVVGVTVSFFKPALYRSTAQVAVLYPEVSVADEADKAASSQILQAVTDEVGYTPTIKSRVISGDGVIAIEAVATHPNLAALGATKAALAYQKSSPQAAIRIVTKGEIPESPYAPDHLLYALAGSILGVAVGFAAEFALLAGEYRIKDGLVTDVRGSIRSPEVFSKSHTPPQGVLTGQSRFSVNGPHDAFNVLSAHQTESGLHLVPNLQQHTNRWPPSAASSTGAISTGPVVNNVAHINEYQAERGRAFQLQDQINNIQALPHHGALRGTGQHDTPAVVAVLPSRPQAEPNQKLKKPATGAFSAAALDAAFTSSIHSEKADKPTASGAFSAAASQHHQPLQSSPSSKTAGAFGLALASFYEEVDEDYRSAKTG